VRKQAEVERVEVSLDAWARKLQEDLAKIMSENFTHSLMELSPS
jgi:hypothetical protein